MEKQIENQLFMLEELCEDIKINGYDDKQIDELEEITKFIFMSLDNLDKRLKKIESKN